jgi:hyaluronan synthase
MVLGCGFRVVYQREAVVLTKVPITFTGLRRMLLRWARSNVRENLVMLSFMIGRFRATDSGSGWIRLFSSTQFIRMTIGEAFKFAVMTQLLLAPVHTLFTLTMACIISAFLPALVYQKRYGGWFGWYWAIPYAFYWLFCLCWISLWGLLTASRSGWLTRGLSDVAPLSKLPTALPAAGTSRVFSKAA